MKVETKMRKKAMAGFRQLTGKERSLDLMTQVMFNGKKALDSALLEMGKLLAESIMLMEREALAGPDYAPVDPELQKWAHEESSVYIADQKIKVQRPRLRHRKQGEQALTSYKQLRSGGTFSQELLLKLLQGMSAQKYEQTVLEAASAFGVSPSSISRKMIQLTGQQLKAFQERDLTGHHLFALFLDTIHRGGEAFLVALGLDNSGNKHALGFWEGSCENHELCEALFRDLESRGLKLSKSILYINGGSGLIKALKERFGKKLLHQRCVIHKSRNLQKHLAKKYRKEAHQRLSIALEQTSYTDAKAQLQDLEKWLRSKNESAADSLLEAFEEILTLHRLQVPALLRKTLLSTNPIESMFSLVRHSERNIKRTRGSKMLQRWLGAVLLHCEERLNKVRGSHEIAQVVEVIAREQNMLPEELRKAA